MLAWVNVKKEGLLSLRKIIDYGIDSWLWETVCVDMGECGEGRMIESLEDHWLWKTVCIGMGKCGEGRMIESLEDHLLRAR